MLGFKLNHVCKRSLRCWYIVNWLTKSSYSLTRVSSTIWLLQWRHNDHAGISNHQPHGCLLKRLFRGRSKKTSKLRVTGLCAGNSPGPVNSPHKRPVTRKMFPFDGVIMDAVGAEHQLSQYFDYNETSQTVCWTALKYCVHLSSTNRWVNARKT